MIYRTWYPITRMPFPPLLKIVAKRVLACLKYGYLTRRKIRGVNNKIVIHSFCVGTTVDISGINNSVVINSGGYIEGLKIFVRGNNTSLYIGENVSFHRGGASLWIEDSNSSIRIGSHSVLFGDVHIASTEGSSIRIGKSCLIAPSVQIRSGDSHAIIQDNHRINHAAPVSISNRVWIADGALLLKGSTVPPDSVVAARAVVTKAFTESGSIYAGNPARMVKTGIRWTSAR